MATDRETVDECFIGRDSNFARRTREKFCNSSQASR
jgi:hypothetical protein